MTEVCDSVYRTGVLNPSMRTFDVTMHTEYGTSYNSYVVRGASKTALIDTAHGSYRSYYFDNLAEALSGATPDYLVVQHCELDHSGCVASILAKWPDIEVYCTQAAALYLAQIVNGPIAHLHTIHNGDTLDLGGLTLEFYVAPFLHWPDTMFTWLPERQVLFTCDFLGSHFCEPEWLDTRIHGHAAFASAVANYYQAIFGPFGPYVQKGLAIMDALPVAYACTSHGPVLTKGCALDKVVAAYRSWATPTRRGALLIPVFYTSAYGNTQALACAIAAGIREALPGAQAECHCVNEEPEGTLTELLNASDAFCVGSTTINRDATPPVWRLLAGIDAVTIPKRPCAVFGSYGWSGEAAPHLAERLLSLKANVFEEQYRVRFVPTEAELAEARAFGARFASFATNQ
jgi:flavorubredoxin